MTYPDHIGDAPLPYSEQEIDASTPLRVFDSLHAVTRIVIPKPFYVCADFDHLRTLLDIVGHVLPVEHADVAYRCWLAYSAGYTGRRCLTCSISALEYWYQCGRTLRAAHDKPGMVKR